MRHRGRMLLLGFFSWLIPFVAAFPFYSPDEGLLIDVFLFKSIMIVVGAASGCYLLIQFFKKEKENYLASGASTGFAWLVINLLLDLIILIPMSGLTYDDYFMQIGIRYLVIPIISTSMGFILQKKAL